jgi:hypothetical protein
VATANQLQTQGGVCMSKFRFRGFDEYSVIGCLTVFGDEVTQLNRAEVEMLQLESRHIADLFGVQDFASYNRFPSQLPSVTCVLHSQLNSLGSAVDFEKLIFGGVEFR